MMLRIIPVLILIPLLTSSAIIYVFPHVLEGPLDTTESVVVGIIVSGIAGLVMYSTIFFMGVGRGSSGVMSQAMVFPLFVALGLLAILLGAAVGIGFDLANVTEIAMSAMIGGVIFFIVALFLFMLLRVNISYVKG